MSNHIEEREFTATINYSLFRKLAAIGDREGTTAGQALYKAIAVYTVLLEEVAAGAKVVLRHADGTETEVTGIGGKP